MIRIGLLAVLLCPVMWAASPRPAVVNAVSDAYRPFPFDQEKLGGIIGARLRANSEGYIEKIADLAPDAADASGTLLEAAVYAFEYNHDPQVNTIMQKLAKKVASSQARDGFLGTRANPGEWTERDTWIQNAGLTGLMNYYRISGDQIALTAAIKAGNLLVAERNKSKEPAAFAGAIRGMVQLFRYSDDAKYLDFCTATAEAWLHAKRPEPSMDQTNLAILNGLVDLYRVNGDNGFFKAPVQAWTQLRAYGFNLTGVPAITAGGGPQALNACTTAAWIDLTYNLLRITGQAPYSEQLERTVYNQLFAGQEMRTGTVLAPVTWTAKKEPANNSACASDEVRAMAEVPSLVWGRYGNGLAINLYTDGRVTVRLRRRGTIQLYTETNYPESGTILLHVEPDHPIHFPLRLRVPEWTSNFTADVEQDHFVGKPGDFLIINRGWKRGDTVRISMHMNARAIAGIREYSADVAIARGPQVLALGRTLNPDIKNFDAVTIDSPGAAGVQLTQVTNNFAENWMGEQAYSISGTYEGQARKLILIPFAEARDYRVWLAQSKASSGASGR